jgi:hypothetical protein
MFYEIGIVYSKLSMDINIGYLHRWDLRVSFLCERCKCTLWLGLRGLGTELEAVGMYIMPPEDISLAYLIIPSHQ